MKRLQMFNKLSSGFELMVSIMPLILTYTLYALITLMSNLFSGNKIDRLSTATINSIIIVASADIEVLYVLCWLVLLSLISSVKCVLCKLLNDNGKLICTLFGMASGISLIIMVAFFIIGVLNNYLIVAVLSLMASCLELTSIIININYIEQLRITGGI